MIPSAITERKRNNARDAHDTNRNNNICDVNSETKVNDDNDTKVDDGNDNNNNSSRNNHRKFSEKHKSYQQQHLTFPQGFKMTISLPVFLFGFMVNMLKNQQLKLTFLY